MTMLYRRKNKSLANFRSSPNFVPVVFLVLIILTGIVAPWAIVRPVQSFSLLIYRTEKSISDFIADSIVAMLSRQDFFKENLELKKTLYFVQQQANNEKEKNASRIKELEDALSRKTSSENSVVGFVLSKPPLSPYNQAFIDVGKADGVKIGDLALYHGQLAGKAEEVWNHKTLIKFFGIKGEELTFLLGDDRIVKKAIGLGNGFFKFSAEKDLKSLDGKTARLGEFPNYPFGKIKMASQDKDNSEKELIIEPAFNVFELSELEIIKNGN